MIPCSLHPSHGFGLLTKLTKRESSLHCQRRIVRCAEWNLERILTHLEFIASRKNHAMEYLGLSRRILAKKAERRSAPVLGRSNVRAKTSLRHPATVEAA
jgi:hypothetical protein